MVGSIGFPFKVLAYSFHGKEFLRYLLGEYVMGSLGFREVQGTTLWGVGRQDPSRLHGDAPGGGASR